jgi:uncharacterized OB-fold protein
MSSRIESYPGTEISSEEYNQRKYLVTHYETELKYAWSSGVAMGKFLRGMKQREIWGRGCDNCGRIVVPPRMYCEQCFRANDRWVRLRDTGTVNTYSVSHVNADASRRDTPILVAVIDIDGTKPRMGFMHLLGGMRPSEVRVGMKVRALWKRPSEREGAITDIRYFRRA